MFTCGEVYIAVTPQISAGKHRSAPTVNDILTHNLLNLISKKKTKIIPYIRPYRAN